MELYNMKRIISLVILSIIWILAFAQRGKVRPEDEKGPVPRSHDRYSKMMKLIMSIESHSE